MKYLILIFSLSVIIQPTFAGEISLEKKGLIDKLLDLGGQSVVATGNQVANHYIQGIFAVLKNSNPNINPKAYDIVKEEVMAIINEEMVVNNKLAEMMYPIYNKYFSTDDLEKMVELYSSPFGKKMLKVMPMVTKEGIEAGQKLGESLGPTIQKRILVRFETEGIK